MVQELLFEDRDQVSAQRDREVEQNNEVLAAEASLACLSPALGLQSQGTLVHLAACWNAEKMRMFMDNICTTISELPVVMVAC